MVGSEVSSETAAVLRELEQKSEASIPVLFRDILLTVQNSRSSAYGRLTSALRAYSSGQVEDGKNYELVCANVTEDLKVASESVIALRAMLAKRRDEGNTASPKLQVDEAVNLIDRLQSVEERKMIAVVSVHALKRSRVAGRSDAEAVLAAVERESNPTKMGSNDNDLENENDAEEHDESDHETFEDKVARHYKKLNAIDEELGEIGEEIREIAFSEEDDEIENR